MATTNSSSDTEGLVGWVWESSGRGTVHLITSCLGTIFLCTWVVIHPRVYQRESRATFHKIALFLKTIIAPEFIAVEGLQEWAQCQRMRQDCADSTDGQFNLVHAFYISMLALRYRTEKGDQVIWPNQYTWLLKQRLINWTDHASWGLSIDDISDKNKSDGAAKLLAILQVSWFFIQCMLRVAYHFPLSQLETMTLGYIPLFVVTYFFWWNKPKDIRSPSFVELPAMSEEQFQVFESMAVSNKFDNEGLKCHDSSWNVWYLTPRVFEKEEEERIMANARANSNALLLNRSQSTDVTKSPTPTSNEIDIERAHEHIKLQKDIVLAHWDPGLYRSRIWPVTCLFGVSFGALHLISWNTVFPTIVEMWLWRASAFVSIISMLIFMHFEKVVLRWDGPLTIISLASPALYLLSRVFMMGEVFAALRGEEPSIYDTFESSAYWLSLF
ncbi:hypothetical protein N7456_007987 [Penicillium angulare]|uniref:Uncharacterized protein n=1 Tax=Penicillium angulare TaxID=116970 RepID=A0A9W9FBM7_9EURO|nr:hypothetical protein N7456_007987 [Penicillium angulare]